MIAKLSFLKRSFLAASALLFALLANPHAALAVNCWEVTGWLPLPSFLEQAVLVDAVSSTNGCTQTPTGMAWLDVTLSYGTPPNNPAPPPLNTVWLLIPLGDPHMTGLVFSPLLVFSSYDQNGTPVINTDIITDIVGGGPNTMLASLTPPLQPVACVAPPNTTMVAWYPFDATTGSTAANPATGNTGTHIGGPIPGTGMVAGALNFDGINDYVEAPSTIVTNFGPANTPTFCFNGKQGSYSACSGDFSIDAWIKVPNAPDSVTVILDKRDPATGIGYSFWLSYKRLGLQLADSGGYTNYASVAIPSLTDGQWHHVAVTVDRRLGSSTTAGKILWYHNGATVLPDGTDNPINRPGSLENQSPLRIGTRTYASPLTGWFVGDMDELEIFNRKLTGQEILDLYQASSAGKCKPPPPPCGGDPSTC